MRLLFVCTGNLCRSPFAERRAAALLGAGPAPRPAVELASAGTRAVVGAAMDPDSARVLAEFGGTAEGHRAQRLTPELVLGADIVLAMTGGHRTAVLELSPRSLAKTFTLLEAAALVESVAERGAAAEHPGGRVAPLAGARAWLAPGRRRFADVVDPIGLPLAVHREVGEVIDQALRVVLPGLLPEVGKL